MNLDCSKCNPSIFISDEYGLQWKLTNYSSFSMLKASQNKGVLYEENLETIHSTIGSIICITRL